MKTTGQFSTILEVWYKGPLGNFEHHCASFVVYDGDSKDDSAKALMAFQTVGIASCPPEVKAFFDLLAGSHFQPYCKAYTLPVALKLPEPDPQFQVVASPANAPLGLVRVSSPWSGEMLRGMRVAAWQWENEKGHREFATHWSTGPQDEQTRLYTEADMLAVLGSRDRAYEALQALAYESQFEIEGTESECLLKAMKLASNVLEEGRTSTLGFTAGLIKAESEA